MGEQKDESSLGLRVLSGKPGLELFMHRDGLALPTSPPALTLLPPGCGSGGGCEWVNVELRWERP